MDPAPDNNQPRLITRIVQGTSLTLGFFLIAYLVTTQQWKRAGWALLAFTVISIWTITRIFIKEVKDNVIKILREEKAPQVARWIVTTLERRFTQYWWALTARFERKYYKSLTYKYRTYKTLGLTIKGKFALDFQEVFVPLKVQAESLHKISSALIPHESAYIGINIWDFLAAIRYEHLYRRIAIIGGPGSGKTTLLEHITLTYARNDQRRQHPKAPKLIPILLSLRDISGLICNDGTPLLSEVAERQQLVEELNPKHNWFENKLQRNKCLVLLDGLDEVAGYAERKKVSEWVTHQMARYPETPFIVTSRPHGYKDIPIDQVGVVLEVLPLNRTLMRQFIHNWYLQNEVMQQLHRVNNKIREAARYKANDLIRRIKENPTLLSMSLNPLLLTMIATVHDNSGTLPTNRIGLYEEICLVLLGKRQQAKNLKVRIPPIQKKAVLQVLALELMLRQTRSFTLEEGIEIIKDIFSRIETDGQMPPEFIDRAEKISGLLLKETGRYEFAHKSLQEYLAATQIKETKQEEILTTHFDDPWWEDTIRLYAAQSEATELIRAAIRSPSQRALKLAYACIDEGVRVDPEVKKQLDGVLERTLESPDRKHSRAAAEILLERRLDRLTPNYNRVAVDHSCITCIEYQLFLDDINGPASIYRPSHWKSDEFPTGRGSSPVTGVSVEAAKAFCQWLNRRSQSVEYSYRLPSPRDMRATSVKNEQVWCWCLQEGVASTSGITEVQIDKVTSLLKSALCSDGAETFQSSTGAVILEDWLGDILNTASVQEFIGISMEAARMLWDGLPDPDEYSNTALNNALKLTLKPEHYKHRVLVASDETAMREIVLKNIYLRVDECFRQLQGKYNRKDIFSLAFDPPSGFPKDGTAQSYVRYFALLQLIFWKWHSQDLRASLYKASVHYSNIISESTYYDFLYGRNNHVNKALKVYAYAIITQGKLQGLVPPFEGIRIVKEWVDTDLD